MATSPSSPLIESKIISGYDFNKLVPRFPDQSPFEPEMLVAIGRIFKTHGVDSVYGLQLLHRHFQLPEGAISLTRQLDESIVTTKATPVSSLDMKEIRGQLYLLNEAGKFQAYQYEYGSTTSFPSAFLTDLANFIQKNHLRHKIALVSTEHLPKSRMVELAVGNDATVTFSGKWSGNEEGTRIRWSFKDGRHQEESQGKTEGYYDCGCQYECECCECCYCCTCLGSCNCTYVDDCCPCGGRAYCIYNGVVDSYPSLEPFDFENHDIKTMLQSEGLI